MLFYISYFKTVLKSTHYLTALLLIIALLFGMPLSVSAAYGIVDGEFGSLTWTLDLFEGELIISGTGAMNDRSVNAAIS